MALPTGQAGNLEPRRIRVTTSAVTLEALCWEPANRPESAPVALCLHGFPDTPFSWRRIPQESTAAGWRVVAPFMGPTRPHPLGGH